MAKQHYQTFKAKNLSGGSSNIGTSRRQGLLRFTVDFNSRELEMSLGRMAQEGQDVLTRFSVLALRRAMKETQELLLEQEIGDGRTARDVRNDAVAGSKNIYVRLAESLRVTSSNNRARIYSAPYPTGYVSQSRPGKVKLARIHAGGLDEFPYSENLPMYVKSSIRYAAFDRANNPTARGRTHAQTSGMKMAEEHPGFSKTDFLGYAERVYADIFNEELFDYIFNKSEFRRIFSRVIASKGTDGKMDGYLRDIVHNPGTKHEYVEKKQAFRTYRRNRSQ
tara:strand:- start:1158 stop:1994 length:837 start_codon:yes stop_codon:yes gene_type:complete